MSQAWESEEFDSWESGEWQEWDGKWEGGEWDGKWESEFGEASADEDAHADFESSPDRPNTHIRFVPTPNSAVGANIFGAEDCPNPKLDTQECVWRGVRSSRKTGHDYGPDQDMTLTLTAPGEDGVLLTD